MYNENDLIDSPLNQVYERNGKAVEIEIYRMPDTKWTAEVTDGSDNSTVYADEFETDADALNAVLEDLEKNGIDQFIGGPGK